VRRTDAAPPPEEVDHQLRQPVELVDRGNRPTETRRKRSRKRCETRDEREREERMDRQEEVPHAGEEMTGGGDERREEEERQRGVRGDGTG
tara:strand:- start:118 stop:390 length:273 start_codon:yes stop_codon:yes gene_type:complete